MEGKPAPQFHATDQEGKDHALSDYKGKNLLLYFYPKDMTPGCTTEALGFQERYRDFILLNTHILGVSRDSASSHQKFCEKEGLTFPLLVDIEGTISKAYEVWKEKSMFGKKYMGISRESFLINEKGIIEKHWTDVKPQHHPKEVLTYLSER